jgi:tetratricopeptide (TPR) repeat protein
VFKNAKDHHDVSALPKPKYLVAMSLGYRSALADLIFAHVLVWSGIHISEHRRFETAADYLTAVNELDPKYATPYYFADTLLTLQAAKSTLVDYQAARAILERGMKERPYDMQLWLSAGQFMAYVAPHHVGELAGPAVAEEWKLEGARRMLRSCELVGKNEDAPYHCVAGASLLSRAGEFEALRGFVERTVAINDNPDVQRMALSSLERAYADEQKHRLELRRERYEQVRRAGLAFVSKNRLLIVGPTSTPYDCVDSTSARRAECATTFAALHERLDRIAGHSD